MQRDWDPHVTDVLMQPFLRTLHFREGVTITRTKIHARITRGESYIAYMSKMYVNHLIENLSFFRTGSLSIVLFETYRSHEVSTFGHREQTQRRRGTRSLDLNKVKLITLCTISYLLVITTVSRAVHKGQ